MLRNGERDREHHEDILSTYKTKASLLPKYEAQLEQIKNSHETQAHITPHGLLSQFAQIALSREITFFSFKPDKSSDSTDTSVNAKLQGSLEGLTDFVNSAATVEGNFNMQNIFIQLDQKTTKYAMEFTIKIHEEALAETTILKRTAPQYTPRDIN